MGPPRVWSGAEPSHLFSVFHISLNSTVHSCWPPVLKTRAYIYGRNKVSLFNFLNFSCCVYMKSGLVVETVNSGDDTRGRWQKKVQLSDSKKSVNDVKFSPRYLGLKLAAASADGIVRIYEASDVFSLNYWPMQVCLLIRRNNIFVEGQV